ncbi:melanocyte-stimulating hormone receptor-like [Oculina patagonica]
MGSNSRPETVVITNCVLNALLMMISIFENTLVLAAISKTPSLRSPSTILLCSLAVSDLFVGLVLQPVYIAYYLTENGSLFQALSIMAALGCGVSLLIMTAITVDRFLALHYHMRYPNLMTIHRALYTSATLWLICFLLSLLSFWKMDAYYFAAAFGIIICLLSCTVCYVRIYRIVRQHQLQIHVQQQAVECNAANIKQQNMLRLTKSAKNTFIYHIVMILCYTPLFASMSTLAISRNRWTVAWTLADTVAFMNSSINPILYCWRLRELRTAVLKTARQIFCNQRVENSFT